MKAVDGTLLEPGTKVRLTHPDVGYAIGASNPQVGTQWECDGVYVGGSSVKWQNGYRNSYKSYELSLANGCLSIWTEKWN